MIPVILAAGSGGERNRKESGRVTIVEQANKFLKKSPSNVKEARTEQKKFSRDYLIS